MHHDSVKSKMCDNLQMYFGAACLIVPIFHAVYDTNIILQLDLIETSSLQSSLVPGGSRIGRFCCAEKGHCLHQASQRQLWERSREQREVGPRTKASSTPWNLFGA